MHENEIDPGDLERLSRKLSQPEAKLTGRDRALLLAALAVAASALGAVSTTAAGAARAEVAQVVEAVADPDRSIADQFRDSYIPGAVTPLSVESVKLET